MSTLLNRPLQAFSGVPATLAAGQTVTVTCPLLLNQRVHVIWLEFGNDGATNPGQGLGTLAALGMIGEGRLLINGKVQRRFTAPELNALNSLMNPSGSTQYSAKTTGTAGAAGFRTRIPIYLAEPWREGTTHDSSTGLEIPLSESTAWNLVGSVQQASLEVDLVGRTSAGANAILDGPVITGFYEWDAPVKNDIGSIVKWRRNFFGVNATPTDLVQLDKNGGLYSSIHLFATSDSHYITSVKFTKNSVEYRSDTSRAQCDAILQARGMSPAQGATSALTPVDTTSNATKTNTGLYNLVFDYDDPFQSALAVAGSNELTLRATYDGAPNGSQVIIAQLLGNLD